MRGKTTGTPYPSRRASLLFASVVLLIGCTAEPSFDRSEFLQRPERKLATYQAVFEPNLEDRVHLAPPEVMQYLNRMDSTDQYLPYRLTDEERKIVAQYVKLLPSRYRDLLQSSVVGIYFISNFAGGGMSDFLYDEKGNLFIALYLNPDLLHRSLKEWIEYREGSAFLADSQISISVETDQNYLGLLHTLVHEASHIYDYYFHATPYVAPFFENEKETSRTTFTDSVWEDDRVPKTEYDFLRPSKYSGYGLNGKIEASRAAALVSRLSRSPFSSLYGAFSWAEDFAETFTWYYLKERLGVGYKVMVQEDGTVVAQYEPSENPLVRTRYAELPEILARHEPGSSAATSFP